jgi:hypothetical protein
MLEGLYPQLRDGDEVRVIGDGPQPEAQKSMSEAHAVMRSIFRPAELYSEIPAIRNYGNPQRNLALKETQADLIMFVDDDDEVEPGAIDAVRRAAMESPGRPLMFRMYHLDRVIWGDPAVRNGNVSGQMFVVPNVKGKLGRWSGKYSADFDFITSTLALHPPDTLVWRPEIIVRQGFAGPGSIGREM